MLTRLVKLTKKCPKCLISGTFNEGSKETFLVIFDSRMMRSIVCESILSDRVAMVSQHAFHTTAQFSLWMTFGKILRRNRDLKLKDFAAFVDVSRLHNPSLNFQYLSFSFSIPSTWMILVFQAHEGNKQDDYNNKSSSSIHLGTTLGPK